MEYPRLQRFARNASFGPASHNALLQRQDFLRELHGVEHDPDTGEHNTPHVARTLGAVRWSGAAYSLEGFNSDASLASGHNPAVGNVIVTLPEDRGYGSLLGVLEVQCADESGNTTPWLTHGSFVDDRRVSVFLRKNTAGLNAQQTFTPTDGDFFISVRAPKIPNSAARPTGAVRRKRGEGLAVDASNWNPMIQAMGSNRAAALAAHTSAGLHDAREVAKAVGLIRWDGSQYVIDAHRGLEAGVQRIAEGQVRVHLTGSTPAMVAPVQAFAMPLSAVTGVPIVAAPGFPTTPAYAAPEGLRFSMVPRDTCGSLSVDVFLYQSFVYVDVMSGITTYRWSAVDGDFSVRVHGA